MIYMAVINIIQIKRILIPDTSETAAEPPPLFISLFAEACFPLFCLLLYGRVIINPEYNCLYSLLLGLQINPDELSLLISWERDEPFQLSLSYKTQKLQFHHLSLAPNPNIFSILSLTHPHSPNPIESGAINHQLQPDCIYILRRTIFSSG